MKWNSIRTEIDHCGSTAPRNSPEKKWPVLFKRSDISLDNIRAIFVSQEVAHNCRESDLDGGDAVRKLLIEVCEDRYHKLRKGHTNLVSEIARLSGDSTKEFNPEEDPIYWTHALKCVPVCSDKDINKEWKQCAPRCAQILKHELDLISRENVALVAIGGKALGLCLSATESESDSVINVEVPKITDFLAREGLPLKKGKVTLYAFIHPAHREQVINSIENGTKRIKPNPDKAKAIRKAMVDQADHLNSILKT